MHGQRLGDTDREETRLSKGTRSSCPPVIMDYIRAIILEVSSHEARGHLGELGAVAHDVLVGGDEHIELQGGDLGGKLARALVLVAHVVDAANAGQPLRELALPVDHDRVGHNDEVRPVVVLVLHQVRHQRHHLRAHAHT